MIIGINAINIKSYGGEAHLINFLNTIIVNKLIKKHSLEKIYVWTTKSISKKLLFNKNVIIFVVELESFKNLYWNVVTFRKISRKYKCDILFLPSGLNYFYKQKSIVLFQNLIPFDNNEIIKYGFSIKLLRLYFLSLIFRISMKNSDGVIYLNKYSKNLIEDKFNIHSKKNSIIPHGFSNNYFKSKKLKKDKSFNIIYVSSIDFYKNHSTLIKSSLMLNDQGYNIKLFFVGDFINDEMETIFKNNIIGKPLLNKILFHKKYLNEKSIIKLMSNMDLVCFPSSCESMGLGLLEGMASHLPVICSNSSSLKETFKLKKYMFNPHDREELTKLIKKIIDNKEISKLNANLTRNNAKKYNWERTSDRTLKFFNECFKVKNC